MRDRVEEPVLEPVDGVIKVMNLAGFVNFCVARNHLQTGGHGPRTGHHNPMNKIHIADPQGQQASYDLDAARRLWSEGGIPRESLYWREGMAEWRPVTEFFNAPSMQEAGRSSSPLIPPIAAPASRGFVKDPIGQTRFLVGLLWAYLGVCAVSVLITAVALSTGNAVNMDLENLSGYDIAGLIVGLLQLPVVLTTGIVFLMWIHRANRNARGLGAEGMTFTPGWSVGWYFIPIANLWKPFQAMKEIWQASADRLHGVRRSLRPC